MNSLFTSQLHDELCRDIKAQRAFYETFAADIYFDVCLLNKLLKGYSTLSSKLKLKLCSVLLDFNQRIEADNVFDSVGKETNDNEVYFYYLLIKERLRPSAGIDDISCPKILNDLFLYSRKAGENEVAQACLGKLIQNESFTATSINDLYVSCVQAGLYDESENLWLRLHRELELSEQCVLFRLFAGRALEDQEIVLDCLELLKGSKQYDHYRAQYYDLFWGHNDSVKDVFMPMILSDSVINNSHYQAESVAWTLLSMESEKQSNMQRAKELRYRSDEGSDRWYSGIDCVYFELLQGKMNEARSLLKEAASRPLFSNNPSQILYTVLFELHVNIDKLNPYALIRKANQYYYYATNKSNTLLYLTSIILFEKQERMPEAKETARTYVCSKLNLSLSNDIKIQLSSELDESLTDDVSNILESYYPIVDSLRNQLGQRN